MEIDLATKQFSTRLLQWYDQFGRHDLPWQKNQTCYRVWISEIMLQQTQVTTVIPYYQKFIRRFPNVKQLASADIDEVLHYWSGLGYYARGRHLHRTANIIQEHFHGRFPKSIDTLCQLPGIGRSTAGAILSLAHNIAAPILDGNVRRVLSRCFCIAGNPNATATVATLWQLAERHTPINRCRDYNQAMMDVGALICTRTNPRCTICPFMQICLAYNRADVHNYPTKKAQRIKPTKKIIMLILKNDRQEILLQKRPNMGIWGGLWSFPECDFAQSPSQFCAQNFHYATLDEKVFPDIKHTFTHFTLIIQPIQITVQQKSNTIMDSSTQIWYNTQQPLPGGIAAPVSKLIKIIQQ